MVAGGGGRKSNKCCCNYYYLYLAGWLALINLDYFLIEIMIVSNRPGRYQDQGDGAAQTLADTRKLHQDK